MWHTHGGYTSTTGAHDHVQNFGGPGSVLPWVSKYSTGTSVNGFYVLSGSCAGATSNQISTASSGSHSHTITTYNPSTNHYHSVTAGCSNSSTTAAGTIGNTGYGNSHNNMPPYETVYMWEHTA